MAEFGTLLMLRKLVADQKRGTVPEGHMLGRGKNLSQRKTFRLKV